VLDAETVEFLICRAMGWTPDVVEALPRLKRQLYLDLILASGRL